MRPTRNSLTHARTLFPNRERETGPIDNYKPTMGRAGFSVKRHKRTFKCFFFLFFFFGRDKKFFFPKQIPTFLRKMNLLGRTSHLSLFARWLGGFGMQMGMYAQRRKILSSPNFFIARFFLLSNSPLVFVKNFSSPLFSFTRP